MQKEEAVILPVHLACRGFEIGLPADYILRKIGEGLAHGLLTRPEFRIWPGDEPVHVDITRETVARWKKQFEEGFGVKIPAELRPGLDRVLCMGTLS